MLKMIVAMDNQRLIGREGKLPWRLPNDLSYFKKMTTGQIVVMGRKTFEGLKGPLPDRKNIVLTSDVEFHAEGITVMRNTEDVLELAKKEHVFIIGGAMVYRQFLPHTERLYVTTVDGEFEGDTHFPEWNEDEWEKDSDIAGKLDENNLHAHRFLVFARKK